MVLSVNTVCVIALAIAVVTLLLISIYRADFKKAPMKRVDARVTKASIETNYITPVNNSYSGLGGLPPISGYFFTEVESKYIEAQAELSYGRFVRFVGNVTDAVYEQAQRGRVAILYKIGRISGHIKICGVE